MARSIALVVASALALASCAKEEPAAPEPAASSAAPVSNIPPLDATNIVSIASGSPDHTTLVAALQAADYVTSVAASGPLTVFAPTNAAFEALPAGALDDLLKPENADALRNVLKYHVTTSSLGAASLQNGQVLGMANGGKTTIARDGDALSINGAKVVASIPASNGMVHVIDAVLLPPSK
ncbi:MAG: fasciclin domain-containing protein [Deltaproteobacteria bacterium]|nr:fasciclin domain-containing protein [Deltaproteobacteria bacterium]